MPAYSLGLINYQPSFYLDKSMSKYMSRADIALEIGVSIETVKRLLQYHKIPGPVIKQRGMLLYDKDLIQNWLKERKETYKPKNNRRHCEDAWGVRDKRRSFVYSGKTLMHILFCQPALRNGRYTYNDCN
jgi:DeoR/GlpR family transcriptional regulator of sugar metabolism